MASKLVPLADAAVQLGVSPDELNEMRQRGDIYGYRDGASWKFKAEDLDKLQQDRASASSGGLGSGVNFGLGSDLGMKDFDLPASPPTKKAAPPEPAPEPEEIELGLAGDDEIPLFGDGLGGSDLDSGTSTVIGKSSPNGPGSDLNIAPSSDILLVSPDAPEKPSSKGPSSDILAGAIGAPDSSEDIHLGSDILGGSDVLGGGGSSIFGGSSDVLGGESQVLVNPSASAVSSEVAESQTVVKKGSDLGDDDDIFGSKSDVTHRPSDSGILLIDPGDSGLSLDQPLDLGTGGSSGVLETTNFQLGGDDAEALQGDDDFLLTPLEEGAEDESDSGSQVIMLDTEGEGDFGEATATLLSSQIPGLLEEESPLGGGFGAGGGLGGATAAAPGMVMVPAVREVPFPGYMVALLAVCMITVGLSGAMMYDLMRSMWSWNEPYAINSQLMDVFAGK